MKRILVAALASLALAACSQQPTVAEVAEAAGSASVALVKEANSSGQTLASGVTVGAVGQLRDLADQTGVLPSLRFLPAPATRAMRSIQPMHVETGEVTPTDGVDAGAEALGKFFRERIFTEANLESQDGDGLVFRIKGEDVCGDGTTPDEACESDFDRFEVRIRVNRGLMGYNFFLELGPDRFEPLLVQLSKTRIAFGVDLGAAKSALEYLDQASGQPTYLPKTMEGVFMVSLTKNGEQDFTLESSVKETIRVETDGEDGPVSFSTGAKDPWFSTRIQGKEKTLTVDLDLGPTDLRFPYRATLSETGSAGQEMALHLGGLSGSVVLNEGAVSLDVTHLGLGDDSTTLSLDGTDLLTLDLNPDSGRHFDVGLSMGADHQLQIKVTPEFDLTADFFYQPLQADSDVVIPAYAVDSTYRFQFTGDSPTLEPASNGFKVVSGTLRLENAAHGDQAVVVEAGRCLVTRIPAGEDPLIGGYAAQDCL
jgi:hypothetical protein